VPFSNRSWSPSSAKQAYSASSNAGNGRDGRCASWQRPAGAGETGVASDSSTAARITCTARASSEFRPGHESPETLEELRAPGDVDLLPGGAAAAGITLAVVAGVGVDERDGAARIVEVRIGLLELWQRRRGCRSRPRCAVRKRSLARNEHGQQPCRGCLSHR
jgi:hypothetical protein